MKKTIATIIACISIMGCSSDNVKEIKTTSTVEATAIASFGDDKVIYVDENKIATIISKSGDILSKSDLKHIEPIKTSYTWKTSIPHNEKDTLYAEAAFVDDVIYYSYYIKNGETYNVEPFFVITDLNIKVLDLPCSSGWIHKHTNEKNLKCWGNVKASLAIWKEITNEFGFRTTSCE